MNKYTFKFSKNSEYNFKDIMSRLDESEYNVIETFSDIEPEKGTDFDRMTIMEMEPDAALMFRLGMPKLKIIREKSEEEQKEQEDRINKNKITIKVKVDGLNP